MKGVRQVVTKKAEISFGEGDSQRRNPLKLSIKKYEYTVCTSKNTNKCGTE